MSLGSDAEMRVVIAGAGFAGLTALDGFTRRGSRARPRTHVTLVDRNSYSTFQPLLYQVATAGLTSADVAYPTWAAAHKTGAHFRRGEITGIDADARQVLLADGAVLDYDYLILATGVSAAFFGVNGAAKHSFSLYTRRDAIVLRNRLMSELERRSISGDARELGITVVGGGATGVELAGTLAELRNIALPAAFPEIDEKRIHVRLIELGPALLAPFREDLRDYARQELLDRGVEVRLGTKITQVQSDQVLIKEKSGQQGEAGQRGEAGQQGEAGQRGEAGQQGENGSPGVALASDITVWAAGISAPQWIGKLGLPTGPGGRLRTEPDLRVVGQERIFAAGDIAVIEGQQLPQLAQPAIQQGRHVAAQIRRLAAGQPARPFSYKDKGIMATIGHRSAVVELPSRIRVRGTLAWLAWLALHLIALLGNRNRISALVNLSWRYLTWSRGGGVIVGDDPQDEP
ncbi:MAG TPA: NAD(P)/FAD-dependent oxidoreductase [Streptosporangiaceae bacterium]|nr:NAD(P)/FAD-dependent oxidoreductase [Streptosporangiaceae bacterium]